MQKIPDQIQKSIPVVRAMKIGLHFFRTELRKIQKSDIVRNVWKRDLITKNI